MKYTNFFALIFLVAGALLFSTRSAEAQLDPNFGTNGVALASVYSNDSPQAAFALPGGKILVINSNRAGGAQALYSFVRFNTSGSVDTTYGTNGVVSLSIPFINSASSTVYNFTRQSDGKIIFVGTDNNDGIVVRFNENGTLDTTFAGSGVHRPNIEQVGLDEVHPFVGVERAVAVGIALAHGRRDVPAPPPAVPAPVLVGVPGLAGPGERGVHVVGLP